MKIIAFLFAFVLSQHLFAQSDSEREIQIALKRLYEQLSFSDTNHFEIDNIQTSFTASANLVANFGSAPITWSVSKYITDVKEKIKALQISSSIERELSRKIDVFGKIAQVFSIYELRMEIKGNEVVRKGISSIQFIRQEGRWLVASLVWDRESEGLKIPEKYLEKNAEMPARRSEAKTGENACPA
jgi:hypothetical protein